MIESCLFFGNWYNFSHPQEQLDHQMQKELAKVLLSL